MRVDTQTILTIHHNIITRNQRVSLSHHDHKTWRLHLNRVEENDRGWYMCQINTDPMRSKRGYLQVVGEQAWPTFFSIIKQGIDGAKCALNLFKGPLIFYNI